MSQSLRHTIIAWAMVSCGASAFAQLSFSGAVNYALPERPDGVVSADFDRDGDKDLAVTRDNPDRVSLLFNTAGSFGAPIDYPTGAGTGAGDMAVADFDGNGFPDIAVSLHNINSVRFFMNSGGILTPGALVSVGANPRRLATGDLDGDGDADVVVVNRDGNTLSILWNSGTGTFTSSVVPTGIEPRGVAVADLNGDTRLDLVFSNHRDRTITVLFNQGSGAFGGATNYSVGGNVRPDGLAVGDLDNDSDGDIVVATSGTGFNFLAVFRNSGGTFTGPVNFATGGQNPDSVVLADFNDDGNLDAATSNQDSNTLAALAGDGAGGLGAPTLLPTGLRPGTLTAADFDGDTDYDLAVANRDSHTVSVFFNQSAWGVHGPASYTAPRGRIVSGGLQELLFSDDQRLILQPFVVLNQGEPPVQLELEGTLSGSPVALGFRLEGHVSVGNLTQQILMYNFSTNQWDLIDSRPASVTETVLDVQVSNPASYVEPGTRRVRALLTWKPAGPVLVYPWQVRIDQAVWLVR
jgi:hypothetical protein